MDTIEILGIVDDLKENGDNYNLKVLKKDTNEIFGTSCNYVADEILFIFANKNANRTCFAYKQGIKYESYCKDWDDRAIENIIEERDLDEEDIEFIDPKDIFAEKFNVVIGLPTRIYLGEDGDCPIANFDKSYEITDILVEGNDVILVC